MELRDVANAHQPVEWGRSASVGDRAHPRGELRLDRCTNENFGWPIVAHWFTADSILRGLSVTLGLTVVAMIIGTAIGLVLAIAACPMTGSLNRWPALHLVLSRDAAAGPAHLLVQPVDPVSAASRSRYRSVRHW